jgi:hypothetical protein
MPRKSIRIPKITRNFKDKKAKNTMTNYVPVKHFDIESMIPMLKNSEVDNSVKKDEKSDKKISKELETKNELFEEKNTNKIAPIRKASQGAENGDNSDVLSNDLDNSFDTKKTKNVKNGI